MTCSFAEGDLDGAIDAALARRPEASALACVDARSGVVLASSARDEEALSVLETSTVAASFVAGPPLHTPRRGELREEGPVDRSLVVTSRWVQVFERVPGRGGLFVVGIAEAGANIGLLASCVRDVSTLLGARG